MNKIILDKNYSDALVCAMYESKKIAYEPENRTDDVMFKHILKDYRRKKIKKKALVYALLYDDLELISPCIEVNNELITAIHYSNTDDTNFENFKYAMEIRDISLTSIAKYRDLISKDDEWFEAYKRARNKNRKLAKIIDYCFYNAASLFMIGEVEKAFSQIPDILKQGRSNDEIISIFEQELRAGQLSSFSTTLFMYFMWIEDITYMMKLSTDKEYLLSQIKSIILK